MKRLFILLLLITAGHLSAQITPDMLLGVWIPKKGDSRIKIEKIGSKYFGKVIWLKNPNEEGTNTPDTDDKNPDPALRAVPILGLRIMKDFEYEGDGVFKSGNIYDPNKGKTYCGKITIVDNNTLDLRGSICGFSLLGRTETWTRYTGK